MFNPDGSDDVNSIAGMLQGVTKTQLTALGRYRAVVQKPSNGMQTPGVIVDTYPPWTADRDHVVRLKCEATIPTATDQDTVNIHSSLGPGANSGGEIHTALLETAKEQLEERGLRVDLLHQGPGDEKPDGHVHLPDETIAHLEAEHATLSKPAKVLHNLLRAVEQGRECIFVVEAGNATKLRNIIADPVNRHGAQFDDEQGGFSYYTDDGGERFTEVDRLKDTEYRIMEATEDGIVLAEEDDSEPVDDDAGCETGGDELREIDRTVLRCIKHGKDDTHQITSATDLPNHKINYSFDKLESLGLIRVSDPETVKRIVGGQKRVFDVKSVSLTSKAEE